jgi:RNA polymerase sigma-70 factor (ECF subfamily)
MKTYGEYTDQELTDLLKGGNRAAFNEIYNRYSGLLYVYAFRITNGEEEDAKDMVQELFISLWDKRGQVIFTSSLSSYLYTAVRYRFLKLVAHRKVRAGYAEDFLKVMEEGVAATDLYILEKELMREVEQHVDALPEKMARIFRMSRFEFKSTEEIAAEMNLSEKTVRNLMSSAVKTLRLKVGLSLITVFWLY